MCSSCGCRECNVLHVVDGYTNRFIVQCTKCNNIYAKDIKNYKMDVKK